MLDLQGVRSLLDLGGGSGVVSFALLRKKDDLTSVVVDVKNVCQAGREIALENGLEKRVTYLAADFLEADLPGGFDMVLLCDVGVFDDLLFRKIYAALNQGGHLVIVDKFAPSKTCPPPSRLLSALLDSLEHPAESIDFITAGEVQARLRQSGFQAFSATPLPHKDSLPWNVDWSLLEARKQTNMA
jgi:SAM-dependent methyltransferase